MILYRYGRAEQVSKPDGRIVSLILFEAVKMSEVTANWPANDAPRKQKTEEDEAIAWESSPAGQPVYVDRHKDLPYGTSEDYKRVPNCSRISELGENHDVVSPGLSAWVWLPDGQTQCLVYEQYLSMKERGERCAIIGINDKVKQVVGYNHLVHSHQEAFV